MQLRGDQRLSQRLGAVIVALAMLSMIALVLDFIGFVGALDGTGAGGAITTLDWTTAFTRPSAVTSARVEFLTLALFASAAVTMAATKAPGTVGWSIAAIGALINCGMFPPALGGYGPGVEAEEIILLEALRNTVQIHFRMGNALLHLGLTTVFLTAAASNRHYLSLWLGGLLNGIASVLFFGLFAALPVPVPAAAMFGMVGFLSTAVFAVRVARSG